MNGWNSVNGHQMQSIGFAGGFAARHANYSRMLGAARGLGAPADAISAAQDLVNYLNANGCTQSSVSQVSAFQAAYNASGSPGQLTVDGQYGGNSQAALQYILDNAPAAGGGGPTQAAPTNCFGMPVPAIPGLDPTPPPGPSPGPSPRPSPSPPLSSPGGLPWGTIAVAGAAVVGAGLIAYAVHKKKGGQGVMHHIRRHTSGMRRRLVHRRA
jgi:hypothetical protein